MRKQKLSLRSLELLISWKKFQCQMQGKPLLGMSWPPLSWFSQWGYSHISHRSSSICGIFDGPLWGSCCIDGSSLDWHVSAGLCTEVYFHHFEFPVPSSLDYRYIHQGLRKVGLHHTANSVVIVTSTLSQHILNYQMKGKAFPPGVANGWKKSVTAFARHPWWIIPITTQ
jgi:hypothetical protein